MFSKGFSKYYQMLTGDESGAWMIDANINLKMKEQGELRDTRWLSAGAPSSSRLLQANLDYLGDL